MGGFGSVRGVFDFEHTEFEENSQVTRPGRKWVSRLVPQLERSTLSKKLGPFIQ
jgi:hypothetical protein